MFQKSEGNVRRKGPLFIVGCPRSGTTLLQRMIDAHPDIAIAPETHFVRRFWLRRFLYGPLHKESNYREVLSDVIVMPEFREMGLDANRYLEDAWTGERSYARLFGLLLEHFADVRDASLAGEKTPNHARYIDTLKRFFPTAVFVNVVRDPRAVVNSWRHIPWSSGVFALDAEIWRRYIAGVRRAMWHFHEAVLEVQYEDLVTQPESVLRRVCEFWGVRFEARMLSYYEEYPSMLNLQREPWKEKAGQPLDLSSIDEWRSKLSPAGIAQVEAVAGSEMQRQGYQTISPVWMTAPIWLGLWPMLTVMRLVETGRRVIV